MFQLVCCSILPPKFRFTSSFLITGTRTRLFGRLRHRAEAGVNNQFTLRMTFGCEGLTVEADGMRSPKRQEVVRSFVDSSVSVDLSPEGP